MKRIVTFIGCILTVSGFAGLRMSGPIKVVDAVGEECYEYVEVCNIVGEVDCVEIIGCKDGKCVSRGYVGSATPKWGVTCTNAITRPYQVFRGGGHEFRCWNGVILSPMMLSETNRLLLVTAESKASFVEENAVGTDGIGLYRRIMVDPMSGLEYKESSLGSFDDESGDSVLVSFYSNDNGNVKVWYEVVSSLNVVLAKGWLIGRIEGSLVLDSTKASLCGDDTVKIQVMPLAVKNLPVGFNGKGMTWLHVAIRRGNALATVGSMVKRN